MQQAARRLERLEALDKVATPLAAAAGIAVRPRVVRNLLSGTDLGHPLPPMLTDLPIRAWVMSALPDAAGGPAAEGAADLLVCAMPLLPDGRPGGQPPGIRTTCSVSASGVPLRGLRRT